MDPGEQTNRWSSAAEDNTAPGDHWYGPVDETYYIVEERCGSPGMRTWWT